MRVVNGWNLELIVARDGLRVHDRRSLARDADRGLLVRVRPGVYAERVAFESLGEEGRHLVRMRALAAVSDEPPVFSHWSAALLHAQPTVGDHLRRVHTTVDDASRRGLLGVLGHVAPLGPRDVVLVGTLLVTSAARTVVDVALASPFREGVVIADGALHAGLDRVLLEEAVVDAAAAGRRGLRRAQDVVAFADGDAESANESQARVSHCELGVAPPVLQWEVRDRWGLAGRMDFGYPWVHAGGEADGDLKYLDPRFAPAGAGRKVVDEKKREDRLRRGLDGFARWGYRESCTPSLLAPILAGIRVLPATPRATTADYSTAFLRERLRA